MNTKTSEFTLSNDEKVIRTYECTLLRKIFSSSTRGYLTVTNKRVVYHSYGKSVSGSSTLLSEMPVDDVVGVSSMVGASINWLFFLVFSAILYFANQLLVGLLPRFFTGWFVSILLMLPFGISWLIEKRVISQEISEQLITTVKESPAGNLLFKKDEIFYKRLFQALAFIGVALFAWNIGARTELGWNLPVLSVALLLVVYFWIFMVYFGRRRTFSLMMASKTSKGSGIFIPGDTFSVAWGRDNTALQSLNAGPAKDAEIIVKELGAMLTDIQQLGDYGIQKWSSNEQDT